MVLFAGFGTIYACTLPTRILSVLYSIIGIPLVLVILADIGKRMCRLIRAVYVPLYKRFRKTRHKKDSTASEMNDNSLVLKSLMNANSAGINAATGGTTAIDDAVSVDSAEDIPDIPVSLGIFLTLTCVFLCALYYHKIEGYKVGESIYYSFLTFVAGDFNTNKFSYAVPVYSLIFLGFSMLSLTISIIQNNIDNLINRVKREVRREIRKQQIMIETGVKPVDDADGRSPDEIINDILQKHGAPWLVNMIPQSQIQNMQTEVKDVINVHHVEIQTEAYVPSQPTTFSETGVMCDPIGKTDALTNTHVQQLHDAQVDATISTKETRSQTPLRVFTEDGIQTVPKVQRDGQMQTLPKLWASNEVQAKPDQKHQASNSVRPRVANRGVTAAPHTRTILMQFPKAHR